MPIIKTAIVDNNGKVVDASLPTRLQSGELNATYARTGKVSVDNYKLPSDPDDTLSWTRAIADAKAKQAREITASAKDYIISSPIDIGGLAMTIIRGAGPKQTVIKSGLGATELTSAFTAASSCFDVTFKEMGIVGSAVDDVTGPRRSRTFGPNSIRRGLWLEGDLETGSKTIRMIKMTDCYVYGTANLPAFITGVRGEARIENSEFDNNYDIGFTNCDSVVFTDNRVTRSCDNGVSLSRRNKSVTCTGNTFENCAYWAIWLAGFSSQHGAENFVVTGNRGIGMGFGGVTCDLGAQNGVIADNFFKDIRRGPTDQPNDDYGVGVFIGGYPADPSAVTRFAENITVSNNEIVDAARGGVLVRGAKNIHVANNSITRPGSQFKADGTTLITTAMVKENFGIAIDDSYINTVSNSSFHGNLVVDDRSTPYTNTVCYIGTNASVSSLANVGYGNRLQSGESAETIRGGLKTFVSGLRVGSSGITAIALRLSAAAGSSRALQIETDSTPRWLFKADGSTESGSNTGSNLVFEPMSDAGASLGAALTIIRSTQGFRHENKPLGFYGTTPITKPSITGSRAGESAASASTRAALVALGLVTDNTTA
ncbi:right-handed parallel beta-helix repeat-containing protein [Paenarthrobacter nicotinovorans]|uniref:right-handed parallel beta-helix repeat-containing protein n=1 Tax=Paenarthrobacter nicotinovorans TaxID=29320 RepID=UPI0039A55378